MSVVTEASCSSIIGVGNYNGGFQTDGNGSMSEREIEHPGIGMLSGSAVLLGFTATSLLLINVPKGENLKLSKEVVCLVKAWMPLHTWWSLWGNPLSSFCGPPWFV